jgi:hypothetical protein
MVDILGPKETARAIHIQKNSIGEYELLFDYKSKRLNPEGTIYYKVVNSGKDLVSLRTQGQALAKKFNVPFNDWKGAEESLLPRVKSLFKEGYSSDMFSWNKSSNTFTAEISELGWPSVPSQFVMTSSKTGKDITFRMVGKDTDGSDEDIYGWRYEGGGFKVLITND